MENTLPLCPPTQREGRPEREDTSKSQKGVLDQSRHNKWKKPPANRRLKWDQPRTSSRWSRRILGLEKTVLIFAFACLVCQSISAGRRLEFVIAASKTLGLARSIVRSQGRSRLGWRTHYPCAPPTRKAVLSVRIRASRKKECWANHATTNGKSRGRTGGLNGISLVLARDGVGSLAVFVLFGLNPQAELLAHRSGQESAH